MPARAQVWHPERAEAFGKVDAPDAFWSLTCTLVWRIVRDVFVVWIS